MTEQIDWKERAAQRRAEREKQAETRSEIPVAADTDLVPTSEATLSDTDKLTKDLIDKIDIIDAYVTLTGNKPPKVRSGQRESIKIICPFHLEKSESASINLDKQTFACHHEFGAANERGGDIYTLGAIKFGYPLTNKEYQKGENFPNLKRDILGAFGYSFQTVPGTKDLYPIAPEPEEESEAPQSPAQLTVVPIVPELESNFEPDWSVFRSPDWRNVIPEGTFLHSYMEETCKDASPENYHLFHGLIALGLACGKHTLLPGNPAVHGNLFVCLTGRSGIGKSRATHHLRTVLEAAVPNSADATNHGVKYLGSPGSGEILVDMMIKRILVNPGEEDLMEQRGLTEYKELAALTGRTARGGSTLKDYLITFFDAENIITAQTRAHKDSYAKDPFLSMLTSTQPRIIRDLLTQADIDSGFLTRLNFVWGQEKHEDLFEDVIVDLTHPIGYLKQIHEWAQGIWTVQKSFLYKHPQFTDEANAVWTKQYDHLVKTDETGMLTRLKLWFKKFTLLMAINERQNLIGPDIIDRVIPLMDYQIDCYKIATQAIGETQESELVSRIMAMVRDHEAIKKNAPGLTGREMQQRLKSRKSFTMKQLTDILNQLEQLGILTGVVTTAGPKGGRTAKRYRTGAA